MQRNIVYQGMSGAFSHLACQAYYPSLEPQSCNNFAECFEKVHSGAAQLAMIPVENTVAGRVSDIYHLLPEGKLSIIAEHYLAVHHQLLAIKGAQLSDIQSARSHPMALGQVRRYLAAQGVKPVADTDTAGAAQAVSALGDKNVAAIASELAAQIYGLDILAANIEDAAHNTTRFVVLAAQADIPALESGPVVTSFVFKLRSVPSALYKALGGFATNGLNITKLESYMIDGSFQAAQFYIDVEGHPEAQNMQNAMEELDFFTENVTLLGTYPADKRRL